MRHNVWVWQELWVRAEQVARAESFYSGTRVTVSELIRRGLEKEVRRLEAKHESRPGGGRHA